MNLTRPRAARSCHGAAARETYIGFDAVGKLCRERNCQARGSSGEHSEVIDRIDVSNWRRIGFPEYELVHDMIKCANFLAEEEDKL